MLSFTAVDANFESYIRVSFDRQMVVGLALLTRDVRRPRSYFPSLRLINPT